MIGMQERRPTVSRDTKNETMSPMEFSKEITATLYITGTVREGIGVELGEEGDRSGTQPSGNPSNQMSFCGWNRRGIVTGGRPNEGPIRSGKEFTHQQSRKGRFEGARRRGREEAFIIIAAVLRQKTDEPV